MKHLIDELEYKKTLTKENFILLLSHFTKEDSEYLFKKSRDITYKYYKNKIFTRGLIEFTNYCKNDCYYCGIRKSNIKLARYRLSKDEILECCDEGYKLGFRTFVLQGGEDMAYRCDKLCEIISAIRSAYPDCAITLSVGEKSYDEYKAYFDAGANRYLLRHETADEAHYRQLHPDSLSLKNRKKCLFDLKAIGFATGTGFMVGSPYQTCETLACDLMFIHQLQPEMIGIGPFIAHHDTPFKSFPNGPLDLTLFLIGLLRLMRPNALIPATTALGTLHPDGRRLGVLSGANVVMPNLSPLSVRKKYLLYDNKISTEEKAAENRQKLIAQMASIGYQVVDERGDMAPNLNL